MIIHYLNSKGEEKLLYNIFALQNIDNKEWEAVTGNNKILRLFTERIEMILDNEIVKEKKRLNKMAKIDIEKEANIIFLRTKEMLKEHGFVEIVMCKDCRYYNNGYCENINGILSAVDASEYCSRAERKDSETK
jgi:hypothetical protein